jgi:HK97 family phage portal protein
VNLRSRLEVAWGVLLRGKEAYNYIPTWQDNQAAYRVGNFERNVKDGWRKNELIYACVSAKADACSAASLRTYRKSDGSELPDHPLRKLIEQPNPFMTEFDFMAANMIYLDLAGCAYWEKVRAKGSRQVVELWPLRPDWMAPIRSSSSFIAGYEYDVPGMDKIPLRAEDVLRFNHWDPLDPYGSTAPVAVAGRIGDVDNATTDFLKLFFQNGGVPMGLLSTKQSLIDTQVTHIRA